MQTDTYPPAYPVNNLESFGDRAAQFIAEWGPRVLGALVILIIGYLIARAVKWAVASLINKTPLGKSHNTPGHPERHPGTVGAQIGSAAFWLVLLVAIVLAAQPLGLQTATGPLNTLLTNFGNAIPNIIGAGLIFFIGWIVASVAKKAIEAVLTAARAERLSSRVGIKAENTAAIPKAVGGVVFALIIIPVTIAALEQLNIRAISDPATQMLQLVLNAIPRVIAAGIILAIAYAIGRFASQLLTRVLQGAGFDSAIESMGLFPSAATASTSISNQPMTMGSSGRVSVSPASTTTADADGVPVTATSTGSGSMSMTTPSGAIGSIVMAAIVLFGLMEAFRQLQFAYGSRMIAEILTLLGSVAVGAAIIAASVVIARFVSRLVASSTGEGGMAPTLIRYAIIILGTAIGLRFMGLADDIINLAFGLILGAMALAAGLAFGLGGRNAAARIADRLAAQAEAQASTRRPMPSQTQMQTEQDQRAPLV